jgi:hypothetical protein
MKKQIISEEFKRMQQLAGVIVESTLYPSNSISDFANKHFDEIQDNFGKIRTKFEGTTIDGIEVAFAITDEDGGIDISSDPKYQELSDIYNEIESVEIAGKTIYIGKPGFLYYVDEEKDDDSHLL